MLTLHRAFDATAGRRLLADDLDAFFARFPRFVPLRSEIERFFAASRQMFFGSVATAPELAWLRRLARGLARAEAG
jgi:mxaA protein